ncbi:hypothetical protein [Nocardiopsis sp. HUAS JQ3]|uniref:hypothetical protein n=1 Tax=Nocardiopsis sp. HUAS JQ3 TaxID=3061629 RepID=UPI0023AA1284|nr:hypothetical protein [Nocardiopsis sp. HUAS JQ3]WDZ91161.1 hypothetical protein PV789_00865 [Nocardiopsis sp. HUAS JQ3]
MGNCTTDGCEEPTSARLCDTCTGRLRSALRTVVELALGAELHRAALRQTRLTRSADTIGRPSDVYPLPVDLDAGNLGADLVDTFAEWVREVARDMPPGRVLGPVCHGCAGDPLPRHRSCAAVLGTRAPAAHPTALAQWLAANIPHIRRQDYAGQLLDELAAIIRAAESAVDLPSPTILAGACPDCGAPVYTRQGSAVGRCRAPGCEGTVDTAQGRADHLDRLDDMEYTAADAARILTELGEHVTRHTIAQWHRRGRITRASWAPPRSAVRSTRPGDPPLYGPAKPHPRFRLGDVRAARWSTTTPGRTA